ncbi:MAG TPA: matrixin family metalloprotease, partial [Blastocatellia bacterium]|nr:matrixin family metalloprotease [Blastocatellia bacterium]
MRDLSGQRSPRCGSLHRSAPSRQAVCFLLSLALLASCLRFDSPVQAGTALAITPSGKEVAWRAGTTVTYHVDQGSLGSLNNAQAVALVDELFGLWQNVPSANLTTQRAGSLPEDVTSANYLNYRRNNAADAYHPVIFDTDGSITDAVFGAGASDFTAGFSGPGWTIGGFNDGEIVDASAVLNAKFLASGYGSLTEFKSVMLHEFGHFLGIGHSQTNLGTAFDREVLFNNNHTLPIMFPLSLGDRPVELTWDDKAQLTRLYPGMTANNYGKISGRVFLADGTTPFQGANVIARRVDDPLIVAVSSVSGFLYRGTGVNSTRGTLDPSHQGYFEISGLPPGNYTVEVEPIHPTFVSGSSVGPLDPPIDLPGPAEYYSGSDESNSDGAASAKLIPVAAGQTVDSINFVLNNSALPAMSESEPNSTIATANSISVSTLISGNVSAGDAGVSDISGDSVKDFYSFTADTNDWVTFDLNWGGNANLTLYLYNGSNQRVALSMPCLYSSCPSSRQIGPMKIPASGTYTIGVGANSGSASYTLQITGQQNYNGTAATVNGASFLKGGAMAPDTIASVFGLNLASSITHATAGQTLPTQLGGVSVEVNGVASQLFFVSPTQINYLIPASTTAGTKSVVVKNAAGEVARGNIEVAPISPALFTFTQNGSGVPAGYVTRVAAGTFQQTNEQIASFGGGIVTPLTIDRRGDAMYLILFGTGIRYAPNPNTANDIALVGGGTLANVAESLEISIGGKVARVDFAGAQGGFYGLDQVNVLIPADAVASPTAPVIIKVRDANGNLV